MPDSELTPLLITEEDLKGTFEEQFQMIALRREIEAEKDIEQLRKGALLLATLATSRQGVIRSLIRKNLEQDKKEFFAAHAAALEET